MLYSIIPNTLCQARITTIKMKKSSFIFAAALLLASCSSGYENSIQYGESIVIADEILTDKIRGGWFAQTIGCTYGGPTEFKYKGGIIPDGQPIIWYDDYIRETFIEDPGLYDDVYMDLTFLEVMAENGVDAPTSLYADRFANAPYKLWHANQAARYNILNGIPAPQSGHWMHNPHADDIDFQIEADFIGMICPGNVDLAVDYCDRIGHIMNYGDGWYGGVFVSALYALAYVCDDIPTIVRESISIIPEGTGFRSCIDDVIRLHAQYPNDWKQCWLEVEKLHNYEVGCPEGVWNGFNIDAKINAAYVVIGLLYGEGDFEKTMEISTRCGQDSDCNPATAAGVLGVIGGYSSIPDKYKAGAEAIADMPFPYTSISLNSACDKTLELLKASLDGKSGKWTSEGLSVLVRKPSVVAFEQSFEGLKPTAKVVLKKQFSTSLDLEFEGNSIVVEGSVVKTGHSSKAYVAELQAWIDGKLVDQFKMPYDYITRKYEVFSKYDFGSGHHKLTLKLLDPDPDFVINAQEMVVYDKL